MCWCALEDAGREFVEGLMRGVIGCAATAYTLIITTTTTTSTATIHRLVEAQPLFLVPECVQQVLDELRRLMPQANAAQLLSQDPDWLLRLQRGQQWLGLHPDSQMGELVDWQPPNGQ